MEVEARSAYIYTTGSGLIVIIYDFNVLLIEHMKLVIIKWNLFYLNNREQRERVQLMSCSLWEVFMFYAVWTSVTHF